MTPHDLDFIIIHILPPKKPNVAKTKYLFCMKSTQLAPDLYGKPFKCLN